VKNDVFLRGAVTDADVSGESYHAAARNFVTKFRVFVAATAKML